jgi:hypothetical protein
LLTSVIFGLVIARWMRLQKMQDRAPHPEARPPVPAAGCIVGPVPCERASRIG